MGKLTSTIGIPIKLLNEAQVRISTVSISEVWRVNILRVGPCRDSGNHLRPGISGEVA